jgi:hypothetical protein
MKIAQKPESKVSTVLARFSKTLRQQIRQGTRVKRRSDSVSS